MRAKPANIARAILSGLARLSVPKGGDASCARAARAFGRDERAAISPILVLLLVPISGLLAVAGEFGYFSLQQRTQQHAADSAALAAAANDDATLQGGVPRYKLEAQSVAAMYPVGAATVAVQLAACPGSAVSATDCYNVVITRPVQFQLARMVGIQSIVASANAMARRPSTQPYCMVATGSGGITLAGQSTGFDHCVARSNGNVQCSSVNFQLIDAPSKQACNGPYTNSGPYTLPSSYNLSASIPTTVPCSSDVNSLSWSSVSGDTTTQYARLCSSSVIKLSGDLTLTLGAQNNALILDGVSIDLNGHKLLAAATTANGNGTTVISTVTPTSGTLATWFTNTSSGSNKADSLASIAGPTIGTFANFAIMDNQSVSNAAPYTPPNSPQINLNVRGLIYAPNRSLTFNGPVDSSIGGYTCISIVGSSLTSNGGKLANDPTKDCNSLGYSTPHTNIRQALLG